MIYENLDSRVPEVNGLRKNMPIAGYCKLVLNGTSESRDERLVFVTGRMNGTARAITLDQDIKGSDNAPILAYYQNNTPQSRQQRPEHIYLSQLEECIWLEESK